MTEPILHEVLEATGYLASGQPAHGVYLSDEAEGMSRFREFSPDALWRSESALSVYFKFEREEPADERIAAWHREIWNQGFAPLLWVISPERIAIYNGFSRPREEGNAADHLLDSFGRIEEELDRLDALAGRLAMETGEFWRQARAVDRRTCVDRQLLSDLGALERDLLLAKLDRSGAQGLIGRSIFTQYLIDRGIVTRRFLEDEHGHGALSSILRDRDATRRLFDWLRDTFNGDMFPSDGAALPECRHLHRVADFLDAVDPESGQGTFFPYQFDVIPVELISSIYEQFAHSDATSKGGGWQTDVHYTRLSLVSLVLDEITDGLRGEETVLDLSCGSGVFLVEALRRLVARRCGGARPSRRIIRSTLHRQIFGVDISEAAVRVAAFSLYLAALELDPEPRPPSALKFRPLIGKTLIIGDAWNVENTPQGRDALTRSGKQRTFDVIVGNPPWSYPGKKARSARATRQGARGNRSPRGVSLDFMSRAMEFASGETRFGVVLSAVQFFTRSNTGANALHRLIEQLAPVTLVNLSYQSGWLFSRSKLPAMVLFARRRPSERAEITTVQVPWSPVGEKSHTFEIGRDDILTLPVADWARKPELLKTAFFGLRRDLTLLDKLSSKHVSLGKQLRIRGTRFRGGLKIGNRSRDSTFLHGLPLLTKDDVEPFRVSSGLQLYEDARAQWPRSRDTYRAPLLLVREFLEPGGRVVSAVAERDLVFTDAFFAAALPREESDLAYALAAILRSSLASWFLLMTGSTFGLWMQRLLLRDIENMPVPRLDELVGTPAGRRLIDLVRKERTVAHVGHDWREMDEAVFDLYGLDDADRIVAKDGLIRAGWEWKSGRVESAMAAEADPDIVAYTDTFLAAVDAWISTGRRRMRGEVFGLPVAAPHRVVRFVLEDGIGPSTKCVVQPEGSLRDVLERIGERMDVRIGESLVGQRTLRVYGPNEVVIIKPAARRHWMGVSALEDADAVVADSIAGFPA